MKDIVDYYNQDGEHHRLLSGYGLLERDRTLDILTRFLTDKPGVIYDVGGGTGVYAFPLAKRGYEVHLRDLTPVHVEKAKEINAKLQKKVASIKVGDALELEFPDNSADAVLYLGPLYHLIEKQDRVQALSEAYRVLKPGGVFFGAAISRFASYIDGMLRGYIRDPEFVKIVKKDLETGQHLNPNNHPDYFVTSYFHHPDELREELEYAGFDTSVIAIEGPVWGKRIDDFEEIWQGSTRENILSFLRKIESDKSIVGASAHIMGIGIK